MKCLNVISQMSISEMPIGQMPINQMPIGEMPFFKMSFIKINIYCMIGEKETIHEIKLEFFCGKVAQR